MKKFNITSKDKLDNSNRRAQFPPMEVLKQLGLKQGMDMADIGTGIGYFSIPATELVGKNNTVYALDTSEKMLEEVKKKIEKDSISNLIMIETDDYDFKIEDKLVDFVLMVNVLHEVDDKIKFLNEVKRISNDNGEFALIDFKGKRINNEGPPEENRVDEDQARQLLEKVGYEIIESIDYEGSFYGIRAKLK